MMDVSEVEQRWQNPVINGDENWVYAIESEAQRVEDRLQFLYALSVEALREARCELFKPFNRSDLLRGRCHHLLYQHLAPTDRDAVIAKFKNFQLLPLLLDCLPALLQPWGEEGDFSPVHAVFRDSNLFLTIFKNFNDRSLSIFPLRQTSKFLYRASQRAIVSILPREPMRIFFDWRGDLTRTLKLLKALQAPHVAVVIPFKSQPTSTCIERVTENNPSIKELEASSELDSQSLCTIARNCRRIERLTFPIKIDRIEGLDMLTRMPNALVKLNFDGGIGDSELALISRCHTLTALSIKWSISDLKMGSVEAGYTSRMITDEGLQGLAVGCSRLETLTLSGCQGFSERGLLAIAHSCRNLSTLSLNSIKNLSASAIEIFLHNASSSSLRCLELDYMENLDDDEVRLLLPYLTGLTSLSLSGTAVSRELYAEIIDNPQFKLNCSHRDRCDRLWHDPSFDLRGRLLIYQGV